MDDTTAIFDSCNLKQTSSAYSRSGWIQWLCRSTRTSPKSWPWMLWKPVMSDRSVWRMRSWMSTLCARQSLMVMTMRGTADWGTSRRPISLCKEPIEIATTFGLRVAQPMRTRWKSSAWEPESTEINTVLDNNSGHLLVGNAAIPLSLLRRRIVNALSAAHSTRESSKQWRLSDLPLLSAASRASERLQAFNVGLTCSTSQPVPAHGKLSDEKRC